MTSSSGFPVKSIKRFRDRTEAGEKLANKLETMELDPKCCVLALPRGGCPVAKAIARKLQCPWDLLFIKKIGAPGHPEYAMGAVSENQVYWRPASLYEFTIASSARERMAEAKQLELKEQLQKWRQRHPKINVGGKTVIVVDDGLATGATMTLALNLVRIMRPARTIVAVPVASPEAVKMISPLCDEIVALQIPEGFLAVGHWYMDFTPVDMLDFEDGQNSRSQAW